jgi:short-subunit dehydrogenase
MASIYFKEIEKLEDRLKNERLTVADFERVRQIPYDVTSSIIPIKKRGASAYDTKAIIDEFVDNVKNGIALNIGSHNYISPHSLEPTFKPAHRLVTALAYALKDENEVTVISAKVENVFIVGSEFFATRNEAEQYQNELFENPEFKSDRIYRFDNQKFAILELENNSSIRVCHTRSLDAPSDFFGHVQTLNSDKKIIKDIEYWDYRSA